MVIVLVTLLFKGLSGFRNEMLQMLILLLFVSDLFCELFCGLRFCGSLWVA